MSNVTKLQHRYKSGSGEPRWDLIPIHMVGAVRRYVENGIEPGSFLTAVLSNDLAEAVSRADNINKYRIADFIQFFYNYTPGECYGSVERVDAWIAKGGLGWSMEADQDDAG